MPWFALAFLVLLSGRFPGDAFAFQTIDLPQAAVLAAGDEQHALLRPADALEIFEGLLAKDPTGYGALWRAARESVHLGMLASREDVRDEMYAKAEAFARRAVEVAPNRVEGHNWLAVSLGRRALDEGAGTKVDLAEEIRDAALTVLALDSLHAGGHHVLGEWHAEVRRLGGLTRFLARRVLGGESFDEASWDAAVSHLERAVELEPDVLIHRTALARVYRDRERYEDSREQLLEAIRLPAKEPTDGLHKAEAEALLGALP